MVEIRCQGCGSETALEGENSQVRLFSEEPWLNHITLVCYGCAAQIFWFPARDEYFHQAEMLGAQKLIQQHASDPFRRMYYRAHNMLTSEDEALVTQLRQELELHEEGLFEGEEDER